MSAELSRVVVIGEVRVMRYAWGVARRSRVAHAWLDGGGTVCNSGGGEDIRMEVPEGVARCSRCETIIERGLRVVL